MKDRQIPPCSPLSPLALYPSLLLDFTQRILLNRCTHLKFLQVCINLCRADAAVAQKLFEGQNIHVSGLIHQRRGSMAELMGGKTTQTRCFHCSCHQLLYLRFEIRSLRRRVIKTALSLGFRPSIVLRLFR